jgi:peptidoglycan-N-acetylglucosamine deacetylase
VLNKSMVTKRLPFLVVCVVVLFAATPFFTSDAHMPGKQIYLTLDMDMDESMYAKTIATNEQWYDPALFTYLEQNHIPATFFVSGLFMVAYPNLIKSLAATGDFSFENHSYDESSFIPDCYWLATVSTSQAKIAQIAETETLIKQSTGQTATYFRFPGVCHNAENDILVENLGYTLDDGTIIAGDPFSYDTTRMVDNILENAKKDGVILMHVGGPNAPESLSILEQIVPALKMKGYEFSKL